ncbi:hypothetical protein ACJMK2_028623 [Sinanodonta woodiana]|uniref:Sperm-associated antigen 17 n=1 Tax=Sinanodonta woodiana TaxID=1069815 RepID=A0ABD3X7P9_SINWO
MRQVRELGNPKGKKPKEIPQYFEVCEPCKNYLDIDEDIPLHLLAKLIKFKLLAIKANDLKRRENEKKLAQEKEKNKAKAAEKAAGGGGKDRAKSPGKAKGGKKTPEPQAAKEGSKLKKRGEEDPEGKFIDDEPDDGADHYIIVYGFHVPQLFTAMAELGLVVNNIIQVVTQDYDKIEPPKPDLQPVEKDEKILAAEEAGRQLKKQLQKELKKFWKELDPVLRSHAKLVNIAKKDYEVQTLLVPENLEDNEQRTQFSMNLFEDIACQIYDLIDARRQWQNYLENLKLIHIPVFGQLSPSPSGDEKSQAAPAAPATLSGAPTPAAQQPGASIVPTLALDGMQEQLPTVDMRYYNDLMNCIPQESVSVALIMNCMLEQVVATEEGLIPPSEQQPPKRMDKLHNDLAFHLSGVAFKLALTEEEHGMLTGVFDMPERPPDAPKQPQLMNFHDDITLRTHHLKPVYGFNPEDVEKKMLEKLPFKRILEFPHPTSAVAKQRKARLQELIHFCATDGLSVSEIDRAFKQYVFECMDLTSTDQNGFLVTRDSEGLEHTAIPFDDPYPFFKGMITKEEKEAVRLTSADESRSVYFSMSLREERSGALSPTPESQTKRELTPKPVISKETNSRPTSSESKRGILRPLSESSMRSGRHSRSPSVHFEKDQEGEPIAHVKDVKGNEVVEELVEAKTTEQSMSEILDAQKRLLDQWCFAEHYEPKILVQVLRDAMLTLPQMDTYYHKRDHSLLVILHNPFNQEFQNHIDWHTELHSNLGFRNYLDYVAESIQDWTKEEEAKYQAVMLSRELEKMREEEEAAEKASEKVRQKSAKRSGSRSKSPKSPKGSRSSSQDRPSSASSNLFIREGSLKAWKIEQDKLKADEEEKERVKSAKRSKSPKKKEEEKDKKPGSRGSAKSKSSSQQEPTVTEQQPADQQPQPPEKYWPFTGYDVGNNLIHVSGITTTLFPTDGGQIRTERTEFTQGTTCVKTSVLKDGHIFTIHILDPREKEEKGDVDEEEDKTSDETEKAEFETSEKDGPIGSDGKSTSGETSDNKSTSTKFSRTRKSSKTSKDTPFPSVSAFGSVTCHFVDRMSLAFSTFGENGESKDGKKPEPEMYVPPAADPSPVPPSSPSKSKKGEKEKEKKSDKSALTPEPAAPVDGELKEDVPVEEPVPEQPFQQLFISSPDGLNIRYMLESTVGVRPLSDEDRRLLVKQSYPFKTKGLQSCEAIRKKYILSEVSRVITSEGTVVKNMMDGSVEVLYADGTVSIHTGPWPLPISRNSSPQRAGSAKSQSGEKPETPTKKDKEKEKEKGGSTDRGKKGVKATASEVPHTDQVVEEDTSKGTWTITYPTGDRIMYKSDGSMEELKPIMISVASDPETNQSMSTRDDHVMIISYPDGTTIVEHADNTRITTYYRESHVAVPDDDNLDTSQSVDREYEVQTIKFVKVECPSYATVEFNCLSSENLTIFGNGTTLNVFPDGYYMLHHCDGGRLEVDTQGIMTYFPRPNKNMEQLLPEREPRYVFSHNADVVVETVDPDGNVFHVKNNGDYAVVPVSSDDVSESSSDDPSKGEKKMTVFKEHAPRFFIVHGDGSGTELLRYQDIAEYLTAAEQSPATAVLKDELPNFPGVMGITILKPFLGGLSEKWLKKYDQESILPPGIRCRDLITLPPKEFKKPGPKFGTNVGQGLSVGAAPRGAHRIAILKCPEMLELRQFVQYKPMSEDLRLHLQQGLREYAEWVKARNLASDLMQVKDPRTEEERINAADLQALAMQHSADQEMPHYDPSNVKAVYETAMAPPVPSPPPTPQPKRTKADWERDLREVAEELAGRDALRNHKIPNYFNSEFGKAFLLTQAKDVSEMMGQLNEDPRMDDTRAIRGEMEDSTFVSKQTPSAGQHARSPDEDEDPVLATITSHSDRSSQSSTIQPKRAPLTVSETPFSKTRGVADTPQSYAVYSEFAPSTNVRPGNPTPAHATGQGSPAPVRPQNPTPAHAQKAVPGRPGNPTPKRAGGIESPSDVHSHMEHPVILEQPSLEEVYDMPMDEHEMVLTRSLKVDVLGKPRKESVPLPSVIKGGRPGAIPNKRFQTIEDPVKRKVKNSVVAGATIKGQANLAHIKGMNLLPDEVDFGILKEGNTYTFDVSLVNTGVDPCRFKIKQPPPATGIRIIYVPGPVAPGMKTTFEVELYAIAVGVEGDSGVGSIRHDLEIVTETDILFLPIAANILSKHSILLTLTDVPVLTAAEYENRGPNSPKGGKSAGTRLVSTAPPANRGIIRPRKSMKGHDWGSNPQLSWLF